MPSTSKKFKTMNHKLMLTYRTRLNSKFRMRMRDKPSEFRRWCSKCSNNTDKCRSNRDQIELQRQDSSKRELNRGFWSREGKKSEEFSNNSNCSNNRFSNCHQSIQSNSKIEQIPTSSKFPEFLKWLDSSNQEPQVATKAWSLLKGSKFQRISNSNSNSLSWLWVINCRRLFQLRMLKLLWVTCQELRWTLRLEVLIHLLLKHQRMHRHRPNLVFLLLPRLLMGFMVNQWIGLCKIRLSIVVAVTRAVMTLEEAALAIPKMMPWESRWWCKWWWQVQVEVLTQERWCRKWCQEDPLTLHSPELAY